MFIPVSLASGSTYVDVTLDATGVLKAGCAVTYKGTDYAANTDIQVTKGDTARLTTTVTAYAEISVVLAGKTYLWFVDLPKSLRYVTTPAYKAITGSTYGKLYKPGSNKQLSYAATGTFAVADAVASVDYAKKEIWFFNTNDEVKKLTFAETPVAITFAPIWSEAESVAAVPWVVTAGKLYKLTNTFDVATSYALTGTPLAATGDMEGNIVIGFADRIEVWSNAGALMYTQTGTFTGLTSMLCDNTGLLYLGLAAGISTVLRVAGSFTVTSILDRAGLYFDMDLNDTYVYVVDATNRCLLLINRGSKNLEKVVYYSKVPLDVVVNRTEIYVSFLDATGVVKYDQTLSTATDVATTVRSAGAAYMGEVAVTDLYSDAADVTSAEPNVSPVQTIVENVPYDGVYEHTWTVNWIRPEYVKLGTTTATVKVNGVDWTAGYLKNGDVVKITVPAKAAYYDARAVTFMGRRATTFQMRTEPKLFPTLSTLTQVNDALPRVVYDDLFAVEGMTDGFSVNIDTDDSIIEFSVNGGEFGKTGTIKNGDIVEVHATPVSLLAQRIAYTINTVFDKPVATWTLLMMQLNGAEVWKENVTKMERGLTVVYEPPERLSNDALLGDWYDSNSVQSFTAAGPDVSTQPTVLSADGYAPLCDKTRIIKVNAVQSPVVDKSQFAKLQLPTADRLPTQTVLKVQSEAEAQRSHWDKLILFTGWDAQASAQATIAYTAAIFDLSGIKTKPMFTDVREAFRLSHLNAPQYINLTYKQSPLKTPNKIPLSYYRTALKAPQYLDAVYKQDPLNTPNYTPAVWDRPQMSRAWQFDLGVDKFYRYPVNEIEAAYQRHVTLGQAFSDMPYIEGLRPNNERITLQMSYVVRPGRILYAVNTAYERRASIERPTQAMAFVRVVSSMKEVAKPTPVFETPKRNSYIMADKDRGVFATQAEAEAYFATLGIELEVEYVQIDGKWIFVTLPESVTASCPVTQPEFKKRFGYVRGG